MRARFDPIFRTALVLLFVTLAWSLWAGAQTGTNQAPAILNNRPTPMLLGVERLEEHHLTFGLDHIEPLRELKLLGEPLWKYAASLIYVLLAFCAARFVDLAARVWLKRVAARTQTELDDLLLGLLHGPVRLLTFVLFLNLGITIFEWSEAAKLFLSKGLILIVASSLTYLGVKVSNLLLDVWKRRTARDGDVKFDDQLFSIIRRSLGAFIIVVGVLVAAQNLGVNITAAVTSLSIGGLAVGLAAQDTLANLFGAVAVFVDKPFRVGDQIKLDNAEGQVEVVGLRSTRLRHPDGQLVAVPNKIMGNAIITNVSARPNIRTTMNLVLSQQLPADKIKRALALLDEIYRGHPMTADLTISFNRFAGRHINIMVIHWWRGADNLKYLAGIQEMNLTVKERFDAEGISFA
ncbi:MAG: mechanosensitive ion channel family protein [Verrucomicrobiota bacterium]